MFETIKALREFKQDANRLFVREFDDEGREIIRMQVLEGSGFLSPYSPEGEALISDDVASFLDDRVKPLMLKRKLHLSIASDEIDKNEEEVYRTAIKNYYRRRVLAGAIELRKNTFATIWMVLTGVFILGIAAVLKLLEFGAITLEAVDIAGWVFLWEAVELFFIQRPATRLKQRRDGALYTATVTYKPLSTFKELP